MPLCLHLNNNNSNNNSNNNNNNNSNTCNLKSKGDVFPTYKSAPYYNRRAMTVQQRKEQEDLHQGEKRQTLSLVFNRLPFPLQHSDIVTKLHTVFASEHADKTVKDRDNDLSKEEYDESLSLEILESENINDIQPKATLLHLHMACQLANPFPFINQLLDHGASINQKNKLGQTPLHILILGGVCNASSKDALQCLLYRGASLVFKDQSGDSPLLSLRHLLRDKRYDSAVHIASCLLEAGADVNEVDAQNQTLLSHSLQHLDNSIALTKILFNFGASVWGFKTPVGEDSAFKWLLQGIMRQRKLENCSQSVELVGELMCNHPCDMESMVLRTMIRNSRYYQLYGPIFVGIQNQLKKYWKEPQPLLKLCRSSVRESFREPLTQSLSHLSLPNIVKNYILMKDSDVTESTPATNDEST